MSNDTPVTFSDMKVDGEEIGDAYEAAVEAVREQAEAKSTPIKAVDEVVENAPDSLAERLANGTATDEERAQVLNEWYPLPEGFPDRDALNAMEAEHGRIRIHRIAPGEAYVVRAMTRPEFKKYLEILKAKFGAGKSDPAEERMVQEELLVELCTLWPHVTAADVKGTSKPVHKIGIAGTASILAFDVQEISNLIETNVGPFEEL